MQLTKTFLLSVAACLGVLLFLINIKGWSKAYQPNEDIPVPEPVLRLPSKSKQCNVLRDMTRGHWKTRRLTPNEDNHMYEYLKHVRHDYKFPPNYQRSDGLCGNISTYEPGVDGPPGGYRAVCDPQGATPCCYNFRCANKSVEDCKCENCFDIRNMKHAEYSSWVPSNPACVYDTHSPQRACRILKGLNIAFVGDSLIRNLYTAMLLVVTGNMGDGALRSNIGEGNRKKCSGWSMFLGKTCRRVINSDVQLCDGNVNITSYLYYGGRFWNAWDKAMRWQNTSFIVTASGIHTYFKANVVKSAIMEPFFKKISTLKRRPRVLWAAPHSPGILKSPTHDTQSYKKVKRFNALMKPYLESRGVPVFDTFNMTDGMMSTDGQHYGIGMNVVKANILLKYIHDAREEQGW